MPLGALPSDRHMQVQVEVLQEDAGPPERAAAPAAAAAAAAPAGGSAASSGTGVTDSPSSSSAASSRVPSGGTPDPPLTTSDMIMAQSPTGSRDSDSPQAVPGARWQRWPGAADALTETDGSLAREPRRAPRFVQENSHERVMTYMDGFADTAATAGAGGDGGGGAAPAETNAILGREPGRAPRILQGNSDEESTMYRNTVAASSGAGGGGGAGGSISAAPARGGFSLHYPSHPTTTSALVPDPVGRSSGGTGLSSAVVWQGTMSGQEATGSAAGAPAGGSAPGLQVLGGEAGQRLEDMRFAGTDLMEVAAVLLSEEDD